MDLSFITGWFYNNYFSRIIAAIVILLIGIFVGRFCGNLLKKILNELNTDKILKDGGLKVPVEEFFGNALKYLIFFAAIIIALNQLGLATTILYIILIVILVVIIILIILAFKDFVPNVTAWFFIHQKRNLKEGDYIKVNDVEGEIININLVETRIKTKNGDIMYMPNSMLTKNNVRKIKKK